MTYAAIVLQAKKTVPYPDRRGTRGRYRDPQVALMQRPVPTLSAGQVLLEVCSVSVCGTDVHVLQTDEEGFSCSSVPATNWETGIQFGHECGARVIAVASDVRQFEIGDYVTADSLVPCRRLDCRTCRAGLWNACPRGYLLGLQADGVFGELAVVPAGSLHSIEPLIRRYGTAAGMRFASLAEPLGVALHAYEQAMRWIRHRRPQVMIHGAGPIGLLFAWTARLTGAERIIVSEPNPLRAAIAGKFADAVVHPSEAQGPFSDDAFCAGADIVFDACGRVDVRRLMAGLAPGGALLSAARNGQELCFETDPLITNGQAIIGTRGHVGHLPAAIGMLAGCDLDPDMFITRSLDGLTQLHELLRDTRQLADEFKVSCRVSTPALRGVAAR